MAAAPKEPLYAKYLVHLTRPFPNFDFSFIKPVRQKAVAALNLKSGDMVIDAGCGSGGSFPLLHQRVGAAGEITGIEISHGSVVNAEKRVARNGWQNVRLLEGDAGSVPIDGAFDGLLMFGAPDIYASERVLNHILPHMKAGARVAFFGAKISKGRVSWISNAFIRTAFRLTSPQTPGIDSQPWRVIEKYLSDLQVTEYFSGSMFLATATLAQKRR